MKNTGKKIFAIVLLATGLTGLQAQQAIPASGGNATGTGGTASYTVGQVVYTTVTGGGGSVAQGVQQTYEITVISGIESAKDISLSLVVYPNPAIDFLTLKIAGEVQLPLTASLYDLYGKLISTRKIESDETRIEMSNLAPATYFLKILGSVGAIKTFKIIKK